MKLKFNLNTELKEKEIVAKLQKVLFLSMLKMHELAVINCPVDTGRLRNSIILNPTSPGYSYYRLADGVIYGVDVEFGTSPHVIKPVNMKALKFKADNKTIFAKKVQHPGTSAQPFMRPALDQVKNIWIKRYTEREFKK